MASSSRSQVIQLYKNLMHLGKEYPKGADYFRTKLKSAFMKNRDVTDPEEIKVLIARGEYIIKELEALYMLRKYRALKKRYYSEEDVTSPKFNQPPIVQEFTTPHKTDR
ncbi:electron transfer flavoprotein regulatory factor 1-like [Lineus longissimus]|uniref:electron transfer flavoprotein regulatory factor 1-like n=1 Tax=Lineus longissimus TaxID=88925 RepID=UPI002B4F1604